MKKQTWQQWARACAKDSNSPSGFAGRKHPLAALTGQDARALDGIVACWELYACSDEDGQIGALEAVRALLPAMQRSTQWIARELIPYALDWSDRDRLWPRVSVPDPYSANAPVDEYGDPGNNSLCGPDQ